MHAAIVTKVICVPELRARTGPVGPFVIEVVMKAFAKPKKIEDKIPKTKNRSFAG